MPQILANITVNYSASTVTIAFNTDLILVKENSDGGSTIQYYNNTSAPSLFETFISTDSISDLITASNGALVLGTVWQINSGSKYSSSVSYAFPTAGSQIRTSTGSTNINSEIIYRGNSYFVQETQSSLVSSSGQNGNPGYLVSTGVSGSKVIDFSDNNNLIWSITGDITFTSSNRATNLQKIIVIKADGNTRNFTFSESWKFIGNSMPASIAANKTAILSLYCSGTNTTDVIASYAVEL